MFLFCFLNAVMFYVRVVFRGRVRG